MKALVRECVFRFLLMLTNNLDTILFSPRPLPVGRIELFAVFRRLFITTIIKKKKRYEFQHRIRMCGHENP